MHDAEMSNPQRGMVPHAHFVMPWRGVFIGDEFIGDVMEHVPPWE